MSGVSAPPIIVGGGIAGLCAALACAPHRVVVIDGARNGEDSSSTLAQGGIAAAIGPDDSDAEHAYDTLEAGAWHNDPELVRHLAAVAPDAIEWLVRQGVQFDHDGRRFALGREGGHRRFRIAHAGGDRTGAMIMRTLRQRLLAARHVELLEGVRVDALVRRDGVISGVRTVDRLGAHAHLDASAVVLATGGLGALYARTTNPSGHRGVGLALALAAGARLRDMEYVQFHPTALAVGGERLPLVTEALRGAGAVLRDAGGRPAMAGHHPLGDLAPRDVVARRLWRLDRSGGAWLDATALAPGTLAGFPTVNALCRAHGFDLSREPVPVTPAAHFHMGGVAVDADGATGVPGLYAIGEVACSGVHGANRLASNSLLECVVMGRRAGRVLSNRGAATRMGLRRERLCEAGTPLQPGLLEALRTLMWTVAGPVRVTRQLEDALAEVSALGDESFEVRVATALLHAAAANRDSLGAHWLESRSAAVA